MVRRALRSRSLRRVKVKTPGSKVVTHYRKRKPKIGHCGNCGAILKGVPRARPKKMQKLSKSKKRPQRPYGGSLCTKCTRQLFREKAKSLK